MKLRKKVIALIGSSRGEISEKSLAAAERIDYLAAKNDCILLTGACYGIPHAGIKAAKLAGGFTMGISAARNQEEQVTKYNSPLDSFDVLIFSGMGDMGRIILHVRSADYVILIQGGAGTLAELGQSIGEKKIIGILLETGGISDITQEIIERITPAPRAKIIFESNPDELFAKLMTHETCNI